MKKMYEIHVESTLELHGIHLKLHGIHLEVHGIHLELHGIHLEVHGIHLKVHGIHVEMYGIHGRGVWNPCEIYGTEPFHMDSTWNVGAQ